MFRLLLRSGAPVCVSARLGLHKLASVQEVASLPPKKRQSFLYPFSGVESYLHRCCSVCLMSLLSAGAFDSNTCMFSGRWTGPPLSSSTPAWRTWSKRRSSSSRLRLIRSIITSLQRGWTTPRFSSPRRSGPGLISHLLYFYYYYDADLLQKENLFKITFRK